VLIIPSSWSSQRAVTTRHQAVFWCHCRGERRLLQGEFRTHNLLLFFCFALFYFCLHHFMKNTKNISFYFKLLFMSSLVAATMSPEEMIFTFKQKSEESFKEAWSRIYDWHGKLNRK
jgi:hypothetical protein